jgi:hypothetical protein
MIISSSHKQMSIQPKKNSQFAACMRPDATLYETHLLSRKKKTKHISSLGTLMLYLNQVRAWWLLEQAGAKEAIKCFSNGLNIYSHGGGWSGVLFKPISIELSYIQKWDLIEGDMT